MELDEMGVAQEATYKIWPVAKIEKVDNLSDGTASVAQSDRALPGGEEVGGLNPSWRTI